MDVSLEAVGAEEVGDIALNFIQRCIALVKEARCQREQRNVHIAAGLLHELVDAGLVFMALMTGEQSSCSEFHYEGLRQRHRPSRGPDESSELLQ